ncbi:MAG TPA: M23 family metallopeptidase [Bacteroidales bacterium]|nr:M23 family metallopeptidase [Bacteroidales bacterium]
MARNRKYELDLTDLQYKLIRLPWKTRIFRFLIWFGFSVVISSFYYVIFQTRFGSPKEKLLTQQLENMKLQYSLLGRELDRTVEDLSGFMQSDEIRYRPILGMNAIPASYRKGGVGGVERFSDLKGYGTTDMMISFRKRLEEIKNMASVQEESFTAISEKTSEWQREMDHFPGISPVNVKFSLGDGYVFRTIHPVLGTPRMHNGQDFRVPYGTEVYATGDGVVVESGWSSGGFGNYVVIDHDYGLQTVYGHLSQIIVPKGLNVKRGDLLGRSGDSGLSSGPHLHYQVEEKGHAINPVHFINNDMSPEEWNEMIQAFGSRTKYR